MGSDLSRLHHVGHVVEDLPSALALYRRLGFTLPPPAVPVMARTAGDEPQPFGAANTHADFSTGFIELATRVREGSPIPSGARFVPIQAPDNVLRELVGKVETTSANLAACLERFEGMHILMFSSPDIESAATRLTAAGIAHGGVNTVRRPVDTERGRITEIVRYVEFDGEQGTRPGAVAEGRVGIAGDLDPEIQGARCAEHPNGAFALLDVLLCVEDDVLRSTVKRYQTYLDRQPHEYGGKAVFELEGSSLSVVAASRLGTLLPGESPPALPALVSCTVAVRELGVTGDLLRDNGIPVHRSGEGDIFVPASAAFGTAMAFREVSP
ncbi:VOC family protein [Saccharomonospora sp. NPDC006951]